jgi:hypothetical protein
MTTADELTLRAYLQALKEDGAGVDAEELKEQLPGTTRRPLEELLELTMAEIKQILAGEVYREIAPLIPGDANEVVLVAEGQEALAAEVMRAEQFNWMEYKRRAREVARG